MKETNPDRKPADRATVFESTDDDGVGQTTIWDIGYDAALVLTEWDCGNIGLYLKFDEEEEDDNGICD